MKQSELTLAIALTLITARNNEQTIKDTDIVNLLANNKGATRCSYSAVTDVPVSASNKKAGIEILKVTASTMNLYNSLKDETNPYLNKFKKEGITDYQLSGNWHEHYNDCYSVVQKKSNPVFKYLYCLPDSSKSLFIMNGKQVSREVVASYQTPSEAKKTLGETTTYSVKNDVEVETVCRCYSLDNIVSITAIKQELSV